MAPLEEFLRSFRIADAFDIAFVAVFIYTVLTWFKETTSRYAFIGVGLLTLVYFVARAFNMYMTVFLFQAVFAVLLIALIVVFQEDLRRAFERLAAFGPLRDRLQPAAEFGQVDVLVEMAFDLAMKKVGALVVLKGKDPLDRHIEGGIPLDARITKPLLDSIFDPHSMGHDGAAIIEHQRLRQFATHLPLSKNMQELGARGTRHSAALGLSECCDALCIVVSEESGHVSVAERGKLTRMSAPADLKNRLVRFHERHFPQEEKTFWTTLIRENARLKVASLLIACLAWILMVYEAETIQQTFNVPIEYRNRADDLVLDDATPVQARVTLSGYQRAFNLLDPAELKFSVDLGRFDEGEHRIELDGSRIRRTSTLEIDRISPRTITVILHRPRNIELVVEPTTTGRVPPPAELVSITPNPGKIKAILLRPNAGELGKIYSEPISLARINKSTTVKARLTLPEDVRLLKGAPATVDVRLEVRQPGAAKPNNAREAAEQ